jgi:hypothetical protein
MPILDNFHSHWLYYKDKIKEVKDRLLIPLMPLIFWIKFLCHCYDSRQFNPLFMKKNMLVLVGLQPKDKVTSSSKGELIRLTTHKEKRWFEIKNLLLLGSLQSRAVKVIDMTLLTYSLELSNPFNKESLIKILEKKQALAKRLLNYLKKINGREWNQVWALENMSIYERNSLLQYQIIHGMHKALQRSKAPPLIDDVNRALKKGLFPLLVTRGLSGSYWMRGTDRQIAGLFKPFDEEIFAPNNPTGAERQGALGLRKTRWGIRVGESAHREVAAFLVDQFFGFGIVPRTYYATFTHFSFYDALEGIYATTRKAKKKMGSFQEFMEGFHTFDTLSKEEQHKISIEEFQLLIVLDMILGNSDRNTGNILVAGEKIAAVDHGLCLLDVHEHLTLWPLGVPQAKHPLFPALKELFFQFPFEKLSWKLRKNCFIPVNALKRMRERVVLFREGLRADLTPYQMINLMTEENLDKLAELDLTLEKRAREIVEDYSRLT